MSLVTCPRCSRQVAGGRFCPGCGARLDDPLTGKVIAGRVKLVAQTGRGPFFATYRAEHKGGGTVWAVKVLEPAVAGDDGRKRRFLENAGAMMALGDPRVLPVREMAEEEVADGGARPRRVVFAVADGPAGPSLAELVRRQGPLDTHRAAAFGRGMLEALGAVHAAGMVHGDLHPGCVFLEPDGEARERVRLADAGLSAGLVGPAGESPDPAALGSDGGRWISPEQAQGQAAGKASDLHAAGAVIYFALTGSPPWQAEKGASLLFEIQKSVPRAASEMQARVPGALDRVLDRAFSKAAPERFRTAAEFGKALADATADVAPVPRPALPDDVTPGALTTPGMVAASTDEVTMTAAPARKRPPFEDATIHGKMEPTGDETLIAGANALSPPPRRPEPAPDAATVIAAPPPKPRPAPAPAPPRPPAKPKAAPAPAPAPDPEPVPPKPAAKPAKAPKVKGPWSVGTPVGVFSILLFLGVGALYGYVWAGHLDWDLPPWLRTLAGRDAIPHVGEVRIAEQRVWPVTLNVEVPSEIADPLEGQREKGYWGEWRLEKDPAPPDAAPPKEGEAAPPQKVFGLGTLAGPPDAAGVIPVSISLPDGKYRLQARLRYGVLEDNLIEVDGKSATKSMRVVPGRTQVVVRVRQETGKVTLSRPLDRKEWVKTVTPETKAVVFGLDADGRDRALYFGDRVTVRVEAPGYEVENKSNLVLREAPQVVDVELKRDPGNRIKLCLEEIARDGTPGPYGNDADVMADPQVKIAMARRFWERKAGADFLRVVEDLVSTMQGRELPPGGTEVLEIYDDALARGAEEAAARGDLERVRLLRRQAKPGLEFLPKPGADARRRAWAEREVRGWMNYPMLPVENGHAPDTERPLVEGMVVEDLKLLAADDPAARVRQDVATRILEFRAWAAWRAGNELRPPAPGETLKSIPGPAVRPWLDMAVKAWPGIEDTLSFQRLAARLEDLASNPRAAVVLLLGEKEWGPGKVLANARLEMLPRKDRLLLARGLRRWGDLRQEAGVAKEAEGLWRHAWDVYQRVVARPPEGEAGEFPDTLVQAARWEAADVARLVKDRDTAIKALDDYLEMNPDDPYARRLREAMAREVPLAPPEPMTRLGYRVVLIPGGTFLTGADPVPAPAEERPFRDGLIVPVNFNPAREVLVEEFLIGVREVTVGIYLEYLKAMEDPEQAKLYRHPEEPPELSIRKDGRDPRRPPNIDKWSADEPVRVASWWDAWACARFLGGRLPTEAEWEKAALWRGRRTPYPWPSILLEYREKLGESWAGHWPDNAVTLCPFDVAPSGVEALLGGVAEWTMDPFVPKTPGSKEGLAENLPVVPPPMRGGNIEVMCVRGGSFYHRAPGLEPGDSPAADDEAAAVPGKDGAAAAPKLTYWRGIDLMERRGLSAGRTAKWVGFRVVVGTKASEKPR